MQLKGVIIATVKNKNNRVNFVAAEVIRSEAAAVGSARGANTPYRVTIWVDRNTQEQLILFIFISTGQVKWVTLWLSNLQPHSPAE